MTAHGDGLRADAEIVLGQHRISIHDCRCRACRLARAVLALLDEHEAHTALDNAIEIFEGIAEANKALDAAHAAATKAMGEG